MKALLSIVSIAIILSSCATTSDQGNKVNKNNGNPKLINISELLEKKLVGINSKDISYFVFHNDKSVAVGLKSGEEVSGTWNFDPKAKVYPYDIIWEESGKKKGYIIDFLKAPNGGKIMGYWTITDAYITLTYDFTIEN